MGVLNLLPRAVKVKFVLGGVDYAFKNLDPKQLGELLKTLDTKLGKDLSDPLTARLAGYLQQVVDVLKAAS